MFSMGVMHELVTSRSWVLLEKLPVAQLLKSFTTFEEG
jgi:hypothetical protein